MNGWLLAFATILLAGVVMFAIDLLSKPQARRSWETSRSCQVWSVLYAMVTIYVSRYHTTPQHAL